MKKIIRKILKEEREEQFLNKIILLMKDDYPIYKKLNDYGFKLSDQELIYVLSGIFGEPVTVIDKSIYNQKMYLIYKENSNGKWVKYEYNQNGNQIYSERSNGHWVKREYDDNGNEIYYENSDGYWEKREYDENGYLIYFIDSDGYIRDNR